MRCTFRCCSEGLALVPTAITANGDGENDTFRVLANDVGAIQLNVYDMFGQPVFSTMDVKAATETGWDGTSHGKNVPSGWYIWTLQGKHTDGRPLTPEASVAVWFWIARLCDRANLWLSVDRDFS